jgi:hypothetical protein
MIYKHEYFELNTDSQKVFDENGKELYITANAYRMLAFLCEKQSAKLLDIGENLDHAKEYTEEHLRQYRYKINTIIGRKVVEYKNNVYSISGNIEKSERNTDLLQQSVLRLPDMEKIEFMKWPSIVASILLLLTFFDWSYGYYTFLRWIVTGSFVYYAYCMYMRTEKSSFLMWILVFCAVLFNPIVPIHLGDKGMWGVIDVVAAVIFISVIIKFRKKRNPTSQLS